MITVAHLLLMFWLGGAVCLMGGLFVAAVMQAEKFEELELTVVQLFLMVVVWPVTLVQGYRFAQQDRQWRERRRVRIPDPPPTPMALDFDESGTPRALVLRDLDAILPTPCESCVRARAEWDARNDELYKNQPKLCAPCMRDWKEWVAGNAVKAE